MSPAGYGMFHNLYVYVYQNRYQVLYHNVLNLEASGIMIYRQVLLLAVSQLPLQSIADLM
jgi:hypothetical protein